MSALEPRFAVLALAVFVGFFAQAMSGFGGVIISLTLAAHLFAVDDLVPVLVSLSMVLSLYLALRYRQSVDRSLLVRRILPILVVGGAVGVTVEPFVPPERLRQLLGALVCGFAIFGLWTLRKTAPQVEAEPRRWTAYPLLFLTGAIQGALATGGPLLVVALARFGLRKLELRTSLAFIWIVLNGGLIVVFGATGRLDTTTLVRTTLLIPVLFVAVTLGEWAHHRANERVFRIVLFTGLIVAAVVLLAR